jgi:hypothetical protein
MRSLLTSFCKAFLVLPRSLAPLTAYAQQQQPTPFLPDSLARRNGNAVCSSRNWQ